MANHKTIINIHARNYIAAVFEKRLRDEGFTCPDDKLLCWYRVCSSKIVNSIIFFSPWSDLPLILYIGYGIYPLFSEPVISQGVHFTKRPYEDDRFIEQPIVEDYPINAMHYTLFSPDIAVSAPGYSGKGIYTLDGIILPRMEKIRSLADAYAFHKERRLNHPMAHLCNPDNPFGSLSKCFIDMALYTGDTEMYSYCAREAKNSAEWYRELAEKYPKNREMSNLANEWKLLDAAFCEEDIESYLQHLRFQETRNIRYLTGKLGVRINE